MLLGAGLLAAAYWYAIGPLRRRRGPGLPLAPWQPVCYFGGLLVLVAALNGPIHDLSDTYLFWVHMGQHLLLTLVVPPLLIAGLPGWLVDLPLANRSVRRIARVLTHPAFAGLLFSAILLYWHTPAAYDLMMRHHGVHILTHLMFIAAALLLWWPVVNSAALLRRLTPGLGMLYLFLVQLPMQLLGAIITFADHPIYLWYVSAPRTMGLSPLDDQRLGGLLMWVPGNLWIWGAMSILFFAWAREEKRQA